MTSGGVPGDAPTRAFYEKRAAEILAMEDLDAAFDAATRLRNEHETLETASADLRAAVARKMWDTGMYSIAQLGRRLGVTKGRADQLLRKTGQPPG